ncbi:limonene-1,2-epoxide hydrolase [Mycobacterium sp. Z3061]|uniref:limonene-1,2-epoxide hydrolase n=1 Tax=Mycobacterium sp. Z3061 TaxID=3073562 RepID=UPI002872F405|nr:limonene-1,2-epoxide hydrolase family protein [Mycobacterium sp. Z3061]
MTELTQNGPGSGADTTDNIRAVEDFLNALQAEDFDTVDELLHDNLIYENVGFSQIRGGRKTTALLSKMQGRIGFEVKIHRIAADGSAVLTERTDALILGPLRVQFWVCGTFELQDGRITLWRDYFDSFDMLKATLRGVAGVLVPSLRATL